MGLALAKLLIEARVNGGRNYNGPKVAKFSEIVVEVKIPPTRGKTERPRGPLLQLDTATWIRMCRIGGRL